MVVNLLALVFVPIVFLRARIDKERLERAPLEPLCPLRTVLRLSARAPEPLATLPLSRRQKILRNQH